jgi:hypothetical protein
MTTKQPIYVIGLREYIRAFHHFLVSFFRDLHLLHHGVPDATKRLLSQQT